MLYSGTGSVKQLVAERLIVYGNKGTQDAPETDQMPWDTGGDTPNYPLGSDRAWIRTRLR